MHPADTPRSLGWRLGAAQRLEHHRMAPPVRLGDPAVRELALLAWRFEPHGFADTARRRRCFVEGYERGYHLAARPAPLPTRA